MAHMAQKKANTDIGCKVYSCEHHCGDQEYCSLNKILVDARRGGNTGAPGDESLCASYHTR